MKMKISVIVPVYNAQIYLENMLESILSQKFDDWELVLIVSKSVDKSLEICQEYAKKHSRIRIIEVDKASAGQARNLGLKEATAEYTMFIDADDLLPDNETLNKFLAVAEETGDDIVVSNYMRLWKGNLLKAASHVGFSKKGQQTEDFRFQGFFSVGTLAYVWGKLYRKEFLDKNQILFADVTYAEDKLFNMQCYLNGAHYAFFDDVGYIYRRNEASVSYQYNSRLMECWIKIAKQLRNYTRNKSQENERVVLNEKYAEAGLIEYILFFGIFFSAKMEYTGGSSTIKEVRKFIKQYHKDMIVKKAFMKLARGKRIRQLSQLHWRAMIRMFSIAINCHLYGLIAIGIKVLVLLRVDERLSDTGLRE